MAYAAVISLKHTIQRLQYSSHFSLVPPSQEIIRYVYKQVQSLEEVLQRLDSSSSRKGVNALDGQIRETLCKFEDVLESHVSNQIVSQSGESLGGESTPPLLFSLDLQDLKQDTHSFTETLKKMEEEYINELEKPLPQGEDEDEDDAVSSRRDFGEKKSKMVGLSDRLSNIRDLLIKSHDVLVFGMAGIGKTTLAKEIFEDPLILSYFDCRLWVTVGRKCQFEEIRRGIEAELNPDTDKLHREGDKKIAQYLYKSSKKKKCLIVLDDVWDHRVFNRLRSLLSGTWKETQILVTSRLRDALIDSGYHIPVEMRFLNKIESWDLLREKMFGEELCPPQLEKAGKKIAENCDGLPLMIVTVANLLSKAEKTPEYWNNVAEKENSLFMDAYNEIFKVLFSSYEYLPQYLKPCFLHMGVFPEKYKILRSNLIKMWIAEGFLEPKIFQISEDCAMKCLEELVSNSLVIVHQKGTNSEGTTKTCALHSSFWHLCIREARKNKFFHVLNSRADGLEEGIKSQRRLCIHNNILFGINDVYNSLVEDDCPSTARSLLCLGPYHRYSVPICFGLRLLRVLDALKIRFYEFPMEILKLVQLRYLALTYNGDLPPSISKLCNLHFLIVHRHLSIKSSGDPWYMPMEIWDMKQLKHLQIIGSDLRDPCGTLLPKLFTLSDVSAHSCTEGVLKRISNLKKLGIRIELMPDVVEPLCCFDHISHLNNLQSLKCVIVNPELGHKAVAPPTSPSVFPAGLKKLHLSGLGYPWEEMSKIASLPNLQVLKLRCYAFQGPKWEIENGFVELRSLLIENTDLVHWKVGRGSFKMLGHLSLKHCYKLEELHLEFGEILSKIEVVDCPLAVTFANLIKLTSGGSVPNVYVHSSWNEGNLK